MIKVLDVSGHRLGIMDALDNAVVKSGADAYVIYASSDNADMRYCTGFKTSDPFIYIKKPGQRGLIIVSLMEYTRARHESMAAVMTRAQAGLVEILMHEKNKWKVTAQMIFGQVSGRVLVPPDFPLALARALGETVEVIVDQEYLESLRAVKTRREARAIKNVQARTEDAMKIAVSLIKKSKVRKDRLYFDSKPLTSEIVRTEMHKSLMIHGCRATDTIVSCGTDAAIPHNMGSGPLHAGVPIIIDMFPQDETTGYFSDMTRTVSKGDPTPEIIDMYDAVREAQQVGIDKVHAGVSGSDVHQAVVEFFKERGYESTTKGFVHNLGHGVGLQVHEAPSLGPSGKALVSGNVITLEPGLYYLGRGGVRLEDIGMVTAKGFNRFTTLRAELVV
jgi:Xaa-Pro aminopeptidase